ncbi:flagellar motor switch protein FliM [Ammoniphilus resinae]|uniref:Flagellar motor switch protein FliM n=1 Tax=Ammoniphilus resinae TaxID=861532 RepID=A0ABS4GN69_9BACL|nr:flagellar motor switch protein FliM [Ammoniphilus resinae]MBP1931507.1 flagellar motor switch protein FliM [Ammoniphilus resinae]
MAEVLSQNEIDALLAAMSSGGIQAKPVEEEQKRVKVYDFKRALRFSKDQIRSLFRIHESFSRLLTTFLSAQLRTSVHVHVASVDQLPYEEFMRSIPEMTILASFEGSTLNGRMLLEMNPQITFAMLNRYFGGTVALNYVERKTGLTEIETVVLERIFTRFLHVFHDAWKDLIEIDPMLLELETNPQFMQIVPPNETVIVVSFSVRIGESTGIMNLCLPYIALEPIIPKLTAHQWMSQQRKTDSSEDVALLKGSVKRIDLPLIVELGRASITIEEFLCLEAGDIIQLNQPIDASLNVRIGPNVKFLGRPGTKKGHIAVRIEKVLDEGVEDNE